MVDRMDVCIVRKTGRGVESSYRFVIYKWKVLRHCLEIHDTVDYNLFGFHWVIESVILQGINYCKVWSFLQSSLWGPRHALVVGNHLVHTCALTLKPCFNRSLHSWRLYSSKMGNIFVASFDRSSLLFSFQFQRIWPNQAMRIKWFGVSPLFVTIKSFV